MEMKYKVSEVKVYWCYTCRKQFSKIFIPDSEVFCRQCDKTFCEEIVANSLHPSQFEPFERQQMPNLVTMPQSFFERITGQQNLFDNLANRNTDNIDDVISMIMRNDPNRYGNPPASKEAVASLKRWR